MSGDESSSGQSKARMNGIDRRLDDQMSNFTESVKNVERRIETQHGEVMQGFKDVFARVNSIKENCAACNTQIKINTGRLDNLDNPKDGVIPKLLQEVASIKTKVGIYIAIGSGIVILIIESMRYFVWGK